MPDKDQTEGEPTETAETDASAEPAVDKPAKKEPANKAEAVKKAEPTKAEPKKTAPTKKPDPKQAAEPVGFAPKAVHVGGESLVDRVLPHMKKIVWTVLGVTVVLSVVFFVRWLGERKELAHTQDLAEVLATGHEQVHTPNDRGSGFPDAKTRATAVLDEIAKQNTDATGHAYRGGLLLDAGKLDEAIAEYRAGQGDPGIDGVLNREGLGLALEAKAATQKDATARQKGLEEALAAFKAMQPDESGLRRAYALYHQGRMLQLLGKNAEAKTAYTKANELGAGTDLPMLIASRLATLGAS
jgi:tetratricopeptide (TPR) repeat protein